MRNRFIIFTIAIGLLFVAAGCEETTPNYYPSSGTSSGGSGGGSGDGEEGDDTLPTKPKTMTCPDYISQSSTGGDFAFYFGSESAWSVTTDKDWVTVTPTSGEAGTEIILTAHFIAGHHAKGRIILQNEKEKYPMPAYRGYDPKDGDYNIKPTQIATKIDGCLPGLFRISTKQQAYFSRGNLQFKTGSGWRFALRQYECGTEGNWQTPMADTEWMDMFSWGTSGWNSGAVAYKPTDDSYTFTDYTPGNDENADLTGKFAKADWGVFNAISNGGNQAGLWRVMTRDEWYYVGHQRPHWEDLITAATVCDVQGVILLPDNWKWSDWEDKLVICRYSFTENILNETQWAALEKAGAVFLPAGYNRSKPSSNYVFGDYWASDHINKNSAGGIKVVKEGITTASIWRSTGCSVRLVRVD